MPADRQPQPGSSEATGRGSICLSKRLKQSGKLLLAHPDPRIGHVEHEPRRLGVTLHQRHTQHDVSTLREFDAVSNQVHEDLANPQRIAQNRARQRTEKLQTETRAFARGPHLHDRDHLARQLGRRERDSLHVHPASFNFRKIENLVDQFQQVLAIAKHGLHGRDPLVLRQFLIEQVLRKAENGRQRRANLVAHIGEELALGFIRRVRRFHLPLNLSIGATEQLGLRQQQHVNVEQHEPPRLVPDHEGFVDRGIRPPQRQLSCLGHPTIGRHDE